MLLREAIEKTHYDWQADGSNLPEAMLAILQKTGKVVEDSGSQRSYRRLDLKAAARSCVCSRGQVEALKCLAVEAASQAES